MYYNRKVITQMSNVNGKVTGTSVNADGVGATTVYTGTVSGSVLTGTCKGGPIKGKFVAMDDGNSITLEFKGAFLELFGTREERTMIMTRLGNESTGTNKSPENSGDSTSRGILIGNTDKGSALIIGKYYALIIGISQYDSKLIPKLIYPVEDAKKFYKLLKTQFSFDSVKLTVNVTKSEIMKELMKYRKLLNTTDNFLIFFAGHGYEDNSNKQGYWFPRNAERDDPTNWISNSDIIDQINSIPSKHKLIISDACFSGGIFTARGINFEGATKSIQELYNSSSCTAMTSGARTEVPDESIFIKYLLNSLQTDRSKFISARKLFYSFCDDATSSSRIKGLIPQYGTIINTENNGGDFIFIRK
jgi:hypothetical protein